MTTTERALAGTVLHVGTRALATPHGSFTVHACQDLRRRTFLLAIAQGDLTTSEPLLARVHSSCVTSETYGGCDCDCSEQLDAALAAIARAGRGVVFYLDQEGRGAGFAAKVRDRMLVQASGGRLGTFDAYAQMGLPPDMRSYEAVAATRTVLGITAPLVLLTNNPEKLAALTALGVPLAGSAGLARPPSPFNQHYLAAKAAAGHRLAVAAEGREAELPGPVEVVTPRAMAEAPQLVSLGSYWLPVRPGPGAARPPHWFRLHAYVDLARGRERVVLTHGTPTTTPVLLRFQREVLLERIPARDPGSAHRHWAATIRAFAAHGAGIAVMLPDAGRPAGAPAGADEDPATSVALARAHLDGRVAVPLGDPGSSPELDPSAERHPWVARLAAAGVALAPPRALA